MPSARHCPIGLLGTLDPRVQFLLANSIWYWERDDFKVEPSFIDANRTYYDAAVRGLDFASPGAAT